MDPDFEQSIPLAPIIVGFLAVFLLSFMARKWLRKRALARQGQPASDGTGVPSVEQRVAANGEWASGRIRSGGRGQMVVLWLVALTWSLVFGAPFSQSFSDPEAESGQRIVLGLFTVLGIVPVFFAARATSRHFRFGESWCCIDGKAGVLDQVMTGRVRTASEVGATGDYTIVLQCVERIETGSGKHRKTSTKVRWHERQVVPSSGSGSRAGIPFSFTPPSSAPETGHRLAQGKVHWQLQISAPTSGVPYSATFIVPVFRMG